MTDPAIDRRDALRRLALAGIAGGSLAAAPRLLRAGGSSVLGRRFGQRAARRADRHDPAGGLRPVRRAHRRRDLRRDLGRAATRRSPTSTASARRLIEHVRQLGPVVVRWPGGCFADRYHWRDGIGPPRKRPRRFGRWREETEPNQFGTHEFIRFCRLCGVEPYLAANVGTGSPEEFQQWVEYCNAPAGLDHAGRRARGQRRSRAVRRPLLGRRQRELGLRRQVHARGLLPRVPQVHRVGARVRRAALPDRRRAERQRPRLDPAVLRQVGRRRQAPIQGWAPHYYCGTTGHALKFTDDQWYEMLHKANQMETLIRDQWAALGEFDREHKIKLIVDEWGSWHPGRDRDQPAAPVRADGHPPRRPGRAP